MFSKIFRKAEAPQDVPELPIVSANIDKFVMRDGEEVLVRQPRLVHFWESHQVKGVIVNEQGNVKHVSRLLLVDEISRTVAMGWQGDTLVEDPNHEPMVQL